MTEPNQGSSPASQAAASGQAASGAGKPRIAGAATPRNAAIATQPHFSQPVRAILLMLIVLGLVGAGAWFAYGRILPIFLANKWLNGLILAVFVMGVLTCFWQVGQLIRSVSWIEHFAARRQSATQSGVAARGVADEHAPRLLAPLAALLGGRGPAGGVISTGSARSILESVASRIDELRDITRYLINLLIFLGLLGTFYGLATTVPAVVETIRALAPQQGETGIEVFDKLMTGLEAQLGGMATAFSSSLLGLAGSLVVGLLELFVTHGQNRFYRELEEWMSGFTRVGFAGETGESGDQGAIAAALDQMAEQIDRLHRVQAERDERIDDRVVVMAEAIEALAHRGEAEREASISRSAELTKAMVRMAEGQERMLSLAESRPAAATPDLSGVEAALHRLVADLNDGREEMLAELRSDLLVLTRAVRAARFSDPFRDDLLPPTPGDHPHRTR